MPYYDTAVIQPMVIGQGAVPLSQGPSLFPAGYQAAWGPIEKAAPPGQARIAKPLTPVGASAYGTGPAALFFGRISVPAPQPAGVVQPVNAPRLQQGKQNPSSWRPSFGIWKAAPRFAQKTRRFSDHPLPVPALQAYNSMQVASRPARIGGRTATRWPNPNTTWPTFGVGGT